MINPKIAPKLSAEQTRVPVPAWVPQFQASYTRNMLIAPVAALFAPGKARAIVT
jgi:hypothetical protein